MQVPGDDSMRAGLRTLETETLPLCIKLQSFNAEQIDLSEAEHRRTVQRMAIGLGVLGTLGSLVGIFLGYSVARHLKRSIYQMSVCVRDAAGKLGQDLPTVNLSGTGDLHAMREQMQGVVRDIEQMVERLQQREHEVLRAEQMSAVGQLAAGAAHELRNPLTSIKMLVQANREKAERGDLPKEHLALVEQEIRRMEKCLQRFIDFARPPKPECRPMELAPVVEQTFALIESRARKQKVRLDFKNRLTPLVVEADGEQIHQILVNLALNALDAMPTGGELRVELAPADNGQIELRVLDTGSGIAAERLPRLFEPFASSKETGLGLGLVVSRRIAENHRGTLDGKNRPEGGACFTLRLPAATTFRAEPEATMAAAMSPAAPR
jgi:two-component system sensor histidine kinase HydH